jgi:hypothetical protein
MIVVVVKNIGPIVGRTPVGDKRVAEDEIRVNANNMPVVGYSVQAFERALIAYLVDIV